MKNRLPIFVVVLAVVLITLFLAFNRNRKLYVSTRSTEAVVVRKLMNGGNFYYSISEKGNDCWLEANILEAKPLLRDSKHFKKAIPVDSLVFLFWKDFYTRKKWPYDVYLISTDSTNGSIMEYKVDIRCFIE
jgi:hypothetical protein